MPFRYRVRIDAIDATHFGLGKGALVDVSSVPAGDTVLGYLGMSLRLPVPDQSVVDTLAVGDVWTFDLAPDGAAAIPIMKVLQDRLAKSDSARLALLHEVEQLGGQLADARDQILALQQGAAPAADGKPPVAIDPAAAPAKPGPFKRAWLALMGRPVPSEDLPAEDPAAASGQTGGAA